METVECGGKQKGEVGGIREDGKVDWGWRNGWDGGGGWGGEAAQESF